MYFFFYNIPHYVDSQSFFFIFHVTEQAVMILLNTVHGGLSVRGLTCSVHYLKPLMVSWQSSELSDPTTVIEACWCWPPASSRSTVGRHSGVNYCSPLSVRGIRLKLSPLMHPCVWQRHPCALLFELLTPFSHIRKQLNTMPCKHIYTLDCLASVSCNNHNH